MSFGWDSYLCMVDGKLASIFVDLDQQPDPSRTSLLWVRVYMVKSRSDGLSGEGEAGALWKLEDSLTVTLAEQLDARFVGRITGDSRREFYFYLPKPPPDGTAINTVLSLSPEYRFDWGSKNDPEWEQYLSVLHPSEADLARIKNRRVVEALKKHGDPLQEGREIRHWIYFKTEMNRANFIQQTSEFGYSVYATSEDRTRPAPWGACLSQTAHPNALNQMVVELVRFAKETDGEYDGWESLVVAPPN